MESSRQIEDTAAAWLARRDSEEWTRAEETALDEWLSASTAHEVAFLRLEAAWEQAHRLQALGAGAPPGVIPPAGQWRVSPLFEQRQPVTELDSNGASASGPDAAEHVRQAPPGRPQRARSQARKRFVLAAGVLLALGVAGYQSFFLRGDDYTTPLGGIASIPLRDGSNIMLNTESKVRVAITKETRRIELEEGEAFFEVAQDPGRPFVVEAGDKRVTAIGTKFSVRRDGGDVEIVVTEGKVRLQDISAALHLAAQTSNAGVGAAPSGVTLTKDAAGDILLAAGTIARTANVSLLVQNKTPHEAEEALSWRTGFLTFDTTRLEDAIAEFNRYTSRKILIGDRDIAGLHISGKFRANNAAAFTRMLHEGFGIQVRERADTIVLGKS